MDVLYGPVVSLQPAKRDFNEGDNIEVDCRVDANPRPSTIQWFKEGDERFVQNGPTLRLNGVTAVNNGRYICSATNHLQPTGEGKLTRTGNATIDVNIKHKPGMVTLYFLLTIKLGKGSFFKRNVHIAYCQFQAKYLY